MAWRRREKRVRKVRKGRNYNGKGVKVEEKTVCVSERRERIQ